MDRIGFHKGGYQPASVCIIPAPLILIEKIGSLHMTPNLHIRTGAAEWSAASHLAGSLRSVFSTISVDDHLAEGREDVTQVVLRIDPGLNIGTEGYRLQVDADGVSIVGQNEAGLFYGAQSLLQLFPPHVLGGHRLDDRALALPCVQINDRPRFAWRGAMLDVARHFMPIEFVRRFIDLLAMHKMNVLHLHLTDDQGWRVQIRRYPLLSEIGGHRRETLIGHLDDSKEAAVYDGKPHSGYYTQAEIRELVAYAATQHVTIVPEIEMPGHAQAAIAAYPDLGVTGEPLGVCTTWGVIENIFNPHEPTIEFLQNVLEEITNLFPSPFIHIGGDEAVKTQWQQCSSVQRRIRDLGLRDEEDLQAFIVRRMNEFLRSRGRRLLGWEEILGDSLPQSAAVMSWRGEQAGAKAAMMGHDVVMAPVAFTYLDLYQTLDRSTEPIAQEGYLPLQKVYQFDPVPEDLPQADRHHILGAQAQLWTEYMPTPYHVEYMAYPRLTAFAEVVWSDLKRRDFGDFQRRLSMHMKRLDAHHVKYHPITSK